MPNKVSILPYLDDMTDECRAVGACNTVFFREANGRRLLCGANTDVVGVRDVLGCSVPDPTTAYRDRPALVVGGEGAARSAIYALRRWTGVAEIYVVNRDPDEAQGLEAPGVIVSCVPDAAPRTEGETRARRIAKVLLGKAGGGGVMLDMCYNPSPFTALGALAEEHGCRVVLGTEAMIWQGLEQDRYWTGMEVGEAAVGAVKAAIAAKVGHSFQE